MAKLWIFGPLTVTVTVAPKIRGSVPVVRLVPIIFADDQCLVLLLDDEHRIDCECMGRCEPVGALQSHVVIAAINDFDRRWAKPGSE
jgi:hypothetical protein